MTTIRKEILWHGAAVKLILDAPPANILDAAMMAQLQGHLDQLVEPSPVKLLIFEGQGDHFSFGASVQEHRREQAGDMLHSFHGLFRSLIKVALPSIALVRGQCLGGGMELALMCNWIFAAPDARFGQPEIKLGVLPPPASVILPLRVGQAAADMLCLTGRTWNVEQAQQAGLVTDVSPDPAEAVTLFASKHLLPKSASSLRLAQRAARCSFNETLLRQLPQVEKLYLEELMATDDANEGIASFLEKRSPVWKNR